MGVSIEQIDRKTKNLHRKKLRDETREFIPGFFLLFGVLHRSGMAKV
jgi:hypothetical protein